MLKRLSGTFSQSSDQLLLPPVSPLNPSYSTSSAPSSPHSYRSQSQGYPFPPTPSSVSSQQQQQQQPIDRQTLHRTLSLLSNVLVALDELRSCQLAYSKAEKNFAKALKELGTNAWGDKTLSKESKDSTIAEALLASAAMYEQLGEVDSKLSKTVQTEYESINEVATKYFKKTAKEEKVYEESLSSLDAKVSKATTSYNNKLASSSSSSKQLHSSASPLDHLTTSHSNYVSTLQTLQFQVNQLQLGYGEQIATRRNQVGRRVAKCFTGLAEKGWRNRVDATKKGGETIGRILLKGVWVGEGFERVEEFEKKVDEMGRRGGGRRIEGDRDDDEEEEERDNVRREPPRNDQASVRSQEATSPRLDEPRNVSMRGPRAPSTSTTNTLATTSGTTLSSNRDFLPPVPQPHPTSPSIEPRSSARTDSPGTSSTTRRESLEHHQAPTLVDDASGSPIDLGGGRTLPRGWYLDPSFANHLEETGPPLSPRFPPQEPPETTNPTFEDHRDQSRTTVHPPRNERRQTYDGLSSGRREGEETIGLRKPFPRYGSAPLVQDLASSSSDAREQVDEYGRRTTTAGGGGEGRESFVRRMSQKYGALNEAQGGNRHTVQEQQPISSSSSSGLHNRSNSRVSNLAKRYSSPPEPTTQYSTYKHSTPSQPHRSLPASTHRSVSSSSSSSLTPTGNDSSSGAVAEPHPTVCACQTCTISNYSTNGREPLTRAQEEKLQKELRITSGGGTLRGLVEKGKRTFR